MRKRQRINNTTKNSGVSLIEVILVVAVIAFLVAVLTPQILGRVEQARISADRQLADSVKRSVILALSNPEVSVAEEPGLPEPGAVLRLDRADDFSGAFGENVAELLEYENAALMTDAKTGLVSALESEGAFSIVVSIDHMGNCGEIAVIDKNGSELIRVE